MLHATVCARRGKARPSIWAGCALVCLAAGIAFGGSVTWNPPEVIASGVPHVSSPAGSSIVWQGNAWHVVYEKNGGVQYAWRDGSGWHPGPDLAPPGSNARDPHVGVCGTGLIVVWSAPSLQEREVFARRGILSAWNAAEVLSNDGVRSQAPVVSGFSDQRALVVWEDSTDSGFRVRARTLGSEGWGPVEEVSLGTADAREPSMLADPSGFSYYMNWTVAWTDWRHGLPTIYRRDRTETWADEIRLTQFGTACLHPSALLARGGDFPFPYPVVMFETTGPLGGATEVWATGSTGDPLLLSADDGIASTGANAAGFYASMNLCGLLPVSGTLTRVTWQDATASNTVLRSQWRGTTIAPAPDSLTSALPAGSVLAAHETESGASLLQAWTDQVGGRPTLLARVGSTAGCVSAELTGPTALVIGPSGTPPTRLRQVDQCSNEGMPGGWAGLNIDPTLIGQVNFEPGQPIVLEGESDAEGWIDFRIHGGGCTTEGMSGAYAGYNCEVYLSGVRSPDVDGDCAVTPTDRAYFVAHLGTTDFCADLDDDGTVTAADVAIVDATLGEICGTTSGLSNPPGPPSTPPGDSGLQLQAWPNPARQMVRLWLGNTSAALGAADGGAGAIRFSVCDAAGRELRRIDAAARGDGWSAVWDLHDRDGRRVPAGCYFIRTRVADEERRVPVLILR